MKLEAAALQLVSVFGDVEANLRRFATAVRSLDTGVDLIVGPELFSSGYDLEALDERGSDLGEGFDGPTVSLATKLAEEVEATIVLGFLERDDDDRLYDTAVVVSPSTDPVRYRKTHLYPPEAQRFEAGDRLQTAQTPSVRIGVMICFEHAFPEIATTLALEGAQVLAVPSAVPEGYEYLLRLRTRARAQDNQVFVVASNLTGGEFCGGSLIVNPRGDVLAEAGREECAIRATLDLAAIDEERSREPALRVRRPELYG